MTMPSLRAFVIGFVVIGAIATEDLTLEERDKEIWRSSEYENDTSIRTFEIKFDEEVINDLLHRITHRRKVHPPLEGAGFNYGFNTNILDTWMDYWANEYNFSEREAHLNQYTHYKTNIQGLDIHFIRVKPKECDCEVLPLLLLHGFPGSFLEFYKSIPLLTKGCNNGLALEVIVPSLPGFGYSDGATRSGLGGPQIATVFKNLMKRLGFEKFYVQAGDMGYHIASDMATLYPDAILGLHTNFAVSFSPLSLAVWVAGASDSSLVVEPALEGRMYPLATVLKDVITNTGYLHFQATKPDTLGIAMSESASGLLSYILMLVSWGSKSDNFNKEDGGLFDLFTREELLDNLMVYWVTNSFTTAARLYAEVFNLKAVQGLIYAKSTLVPVWTTHTKNELIYQSPTLLKIKYPNLLNSTVYSDYGHFFAAEQPEIYADSVLEAMAAFRQWHASSKDEL